MSRVSEMFRILYFFCRKRAKRYGIVVMKRVTNKDKKKRGNKMAFEKKATLLGANEQFQVNPDVKKYTLRDNGFEETKKGNFQLIRTMDANLTSNQGVKLKIVVSDELTQLKLSVTTGNGLRTVNIYNGDAYKETREKVAFTLADLVERGVLVKV